MALNFLLLGEYTYLRADTSKYINRKAFFGVLYDDKKQTDNKKGVMITDGNDYYKPCDS